MPRSSDEVLSSFDTLSWQSSLFDETLRRQVLRRLEPTWPLRGVRIHVVRNQPFEFVANAWGPFLAFSGLEADTSFGPYDDSVAKPAANMPGGVAAVVIWLNFDPFGVLSAQELADWLDDRVASVRAETTAPILVANWASTDERARQFNTSLAERLAPRPGVRVCDLSVISQQLGDGYQDPRMEEVSGSPLSDRATLEMARMFGLVWLPAVLLPPLKAVVCDLDETLWSGILSEDGPEGIVVSEAHQQVQRRLLALRDRGLFLALVSKNDQQTVEKLFASHPDLSIGLNAFSAVKIGWGSKAISVASVAADLRIGTDTMLLVDDNPGELLEVAASVPGVHLLLAGDAAQTDRGLRYFPGLDPWAVSSAAGQRISDLAATDRRTKHLEMTRSRARGEGTEYLAQLDTELVVHVDVATDTSRLADLSVRVNQFNTAFRRFGEVEVSAYMADPAACAVAVQLRDRFSDSGTVAGAFARQESDHILVVDEIVVSCRALGRDLERVILAVLLQAVHRRLGGRHVRINFVVGPRNEPARFGLEAFVGQSIPNDMSVQWEWSDERTDAALASFPVTVFDESRHESKSSS